MSCIKLVNRLPQGFMQVTFSCSPFHQLYQHVESIRTKIRVMPGVTMPLVLRPMPRQMPWRDSPVPQSLLALASSTLS